jgi:hypothetical protein
VNGSICATADGGVTWVAKPSGTATHFSSVYFGDADHGWTAGDGHILATTDAGEQWSEQSISGTPPIFTSVVFLDDLERGWASGYAGAGPGAILATVDGGMHWQPQATLDQGLNSICFVDATHGWAVGDGGTVLRYGDTPDPVPTVPGNASTNAPVLVLVAGLDSNEGRHASVDSDGEWTFPKDDPDPTKSLWKGFLAEADPANHVLSATAKLEVEKVLVMPTAPKASEWPADARDPSKGGDYCIDSSGYLQDNMEQLARWLQSDAITKEIDGHPVILIGHSYGGVISRSMLASCVLPYRSVVRRDMLGIIQLGSPNGGSAQATWAGIFTHGLNPPGFYYDLDEGNMTDWNEDHSSSVEVPVVRFGGTYLPDALEFEPDIPNRGLAQKTNFALGNKPNDCYVTYDSLENGNGSLNDARLAFGGGKCSAYPSLAHAWDCPGAGETRTLPDSEPKQTVTLGALVPRSDRDTLFRPISEAIKNMRPQQVAAAESLTSVTNMPKAVVKASAAPSITPSFELLEHSATVPADGAVHIDLPLDTSVMVAVTSEAGTPTVVVQDASGTVLECPTSSSVDASGLHSTELSVEPGMPGVFTFDVTLPAGVSGEVALIGIAGGGARLVFSSEDLAFADAPTTVAARFETASGEPISGAVLQGTATLEGGQDVALALRDDGAGADESAADGVYTSSVTLPAPGDWIVAVQAEHATTERSGRLIVPVGEAVATVTGPLTEVTPTGSGGTFTSFGVKVPLQVSEAGTYTVSGVLTDSTGARLGVLTTTADLEASESTSLDATIDGPRLSSFAAGPLTVSPIRVTREAAGTTLLAGTGPGLTTSADYSATNFYNFSISLAGPAANPSPTHAVRFTGTALNTASTVASVEYTIDGGTTWQPVAPYDGAYDSHSEDFAIDLDLPDYVYGLLVRQTGGDGTTLPVADWAGTRFTVDTVAPAQVADLAANAGNDSGAPVALVTWLPSDWPSSTTAPVRYAVALDDIAVGATYDADFELTLHDGNPHTVTVTPIDEAGNVGPASSTSVQASDTQAPQLVALSRTPTSVDVGSTYKDVTFTVQASDDLSGINAFLSGVDLRSPTGVFADEVTPLTLVSGDSAGGTATYSQTLRVPKNGEAGTWTVSVGFFDVVGHISTFTSSNLASMGLPNSVAVANTAPSDTTPPTTTASGADAFWHNAPVTVTLSAADESGGSGMSGSLAKTEYKLDDDVSWTTGTSVTVAAPASHGNDGSHTISYRSTDAAGNVEDAKSCTVNIDTTTPAGTFALSGGAATTMTTAVSVGSSVSDAHGPLQMRFSTDGKASWSGWEAYAASRSTTLPGGLGAKTVYAQYRDAAGNVLELSDGIEVVAPADVIDPTISMTGAAEGKWYRSAVLVTLTASDAGSGVASITYAIDGVETTVPSALVVVSVPASPNARHTLVYRATDVTTNTCADQTVSFTIDTTGPTTVGKAASGRKGRAIALRYRLTDNLSPQATAVKVVVKNARGKKVASFSAGTKKTAAWYSVKWKPRAKGSYRYYVYGKDLAGNAQRKVGSARVVVR